MDLVQIYYTICIIVYILARCGDARYQSVGVIVFLDFILTLPIIGRIYNWW